MTNQRLSVLFGETPVRWGLRGNPYLWAELAEVAKTLMLPSTEKELTDLLHSLIRNLPGHELVPGKMIAVSRFAYGGISSGMIGSDFWLDTAIPLLKQRFDEVSGSNLS